jgi:hypothetical protein
MKVIKLNIELFLQKNGMQFFFVYFLMQILFCLLESENAKINPICQDLVHFGIADFIVITQNDLMEQNVREFSVRRLLFRLVFSHSTASSHQVQQSAFHQAVGQIN